MLALNPHAVQTIAEALETTPQALAARSRDLWGNHRTLWPLRVDGSPRATSRQDRRRALGELAAYCGASREDVERAGLPWPDMYGRPLSWRLGRRLRGLRYAARLTEEDLADRVGIWSRAVRAVQDGRVDLDLDALGRWCEVCGDTSGELRGWYVAARAREPMRPIRPVTADSDLQEVMDYWQISERAAYQWILWAREAA